MLEHVLVMRSLTIPSVPLVSCLDLALILFLQSTTFGVYFGVNMLVRDSNFSLDTPPLR